MISALPGVTHSLPGPTLPQDIWAEPGSDAGVGAAAAVGAAARATVAAPAANSGVIDSSFESHGDTPPMVAVIWLVPELPSIQSVSSSLTPVFVSHQREAADRFDEVVPATEQTSGAAFGFDAPAARAQQAILLAVPPALDAPLDEETLTQTLVETQELAHARMARPVDLDNQFWGLAPAGLLPATGSIAVTLESGGPPL